MSFLKYHDLRVFNSGQGVEFAPIHPQYSPQRLYVFCHETADGVIPGEVSLSYNDGEREDNHESVDLSFDDVVRLRDLLDYVIQQRGDTVNAR